MDISSFPITEKQAKTNLERYEKKTDLKAQYITQISKLVLTGKVIVDIEYVVSMGISNSIPQIAVCPSKFHTVNFELNKVYENYELKEYSDRIVFWALQGRWIGFLNYKFDSWKIDLSIPVSRHNVKGRTFVPVIPPQINHLVNENSYVIWETDWKITPTRYDPILATRIGETKFFVVEASWDMTPLEASILSDGW